MSAAGSFSPLFLWEVEGQREQDTIRDRTPSREAQGPVSLFLRVPQLGLQEDIIIPISDGCDDRKPLQSLGESMTCKHLYKTPDRRHQKCNPLPAIMPGAPSRTGTRCPWVISPLSPIFADNGTTSCRSRSAQQICPHHPGHGGPIRSAPTKPMPEQQAVASTTARANGEPWLGVTGLLNGYKTWV